MTKNGRQSRPADDGERVEAISKLAYAGRGARPALPLLVRLLGDENPAVQFAAAAALLKIDAAQETGMVHGASRVALAHIDPRRAPSLVQDSIAALSASGVSQRLDAIAVLALMGRAARTRYPRSSALWARIGSSTRTSKRPLPASGASDNRRAQAAGDHDLGVHRPRS
jgi:HEAT repeat protein